MFSECFQGGGGESGAIYDGIDDALTAMGLGGSNGSTQPAAYLNYIVFDRNFEYIDGSFITTVDNNQGVMQQFSINDIPTITKPGYVCVYLSNESDETTHLILFDELNIHLTRPIEQVQDYYPFGLTMAGTSYQRLGTVENKYLYNGKELQTDLDINWYDYGARFYDPSIGRFMVQDAYAEKYLGFSPYQYAANNPILFIDVNGDSIAYSENVDAETQAIIENFFSTLGNASSAFANVISSLRTSDNIFTIDIGQTEDNVSGQFSPNEEGGGMITFLNAESSTNTPTTIEEMFHAFQSDIKANEYPNISNSNIEFESKLFKTLVYDEVVNTAIGTGDIYYNLVNEGGMQTIDNALIYGGSPLTDRNGNLNMSSNNLQSVGFNNFYQNALRGFVNHWRRNNGPPTYTADPSNHQPRAIIKVQTNLNR